MPTRKKGHNTMGFSKGHNTQKNGSEDQGQTPDQTEYTTANYLPEDHQMNNPACSCAACTSDNNQWWYTKPDVNFWTDPYWR
jgi:hypothetical protein